MVMVVGITDDSVINELNDANSSFLAVLHSSTSSDRNGRCEPCMDTF
jgi:hypothetical protein